MSCNVFYQRWSSGKLSMSARSARQTRNDFGHLWTLGLLGEDFKGRCLLLFVAGRWWHCWKRRRKNTRQFFDWGRALVGHYVARCGNQKVDRSELKMQRLAWSKVNTCRKFSRDEIHKALKPWRLWSNATMEMTPTWSLGRRSTSVQFDAWIWQHSMALFNLIHEWKCRMVTSTLRRLRTWGVDIEDSCIVLQVHE